MIVFSFVYVYFIFLISVQENTVCEEIDLSDNYIEGVGAAAMADMLKQNMFIVNVVSILSLSVLLFHTSFNTMHISREVI